MPRADDIPGSIRIRTDDGNEWRYDAIKRAAGLYECNRSNAAAFASHDVVEVVTNARRVLEREDLTRKQRREIAKTLSTQFVTFDIVDELVVETGRD